MGIWRWFVVALCLPALSCTFLFSHDQSAGASEDAAVEPPVIPCKGAQRCFPLGEVIAGDFTRFEHLDFAQGTVTFWAKAQKELVEDTVLVNLGGIQVIAHVDGTITASLPLNSGLRSVTLPADKAVDWTLGVDTFIALRWDTRRVVSGAQGSPFHLMLRVGGEFEGGVVEGFGITPVAGQGIFVGDAEGVFEVDQLVVYARPLYVEDVRTEGDELAAISFMKTDSAQLIRGGVDVSFATSAPFRSGCVDCAPLAWAMPAESLAGTAIRSKWKNMPWVVEPIGVPDDERIYTNGVALSEENPLAQFDLRLEAGHSYSVYALAHSTGIANTRVLITAKTGPNELGDILLDFYDAAGSDETLTDMFGTFETPPGSQNVRVELSRYEGGSADLAIVHNLVIRENYFLNPSFETPGPSVQEIDQWEVRANEAVAGHAESGSGNYVQSGKYAACFYGNEGDSDLRQRFDNPLTNEEFYAAGAMFIKRSTPTATILGVNGGNSSFFGTGASHEEGNRMRVESPTQETWVPSGVVGYRLDAQAGGGTNDDIYFGGLEQGTGITIDHCLDDAYFYPVEKIEGVWGTP